MIIADPNVEQRGATIENIPRTVVAIARNIASSIPIPTCWSLRAIGTR
jgi:hypothetical protein